MIIFQNRPILIILVLGLLFTSTGEVSANSDKIINPKFKHLNVEDGLTHHETLYVYQDTKGFLWFGTKNGLNKYDGMTIEPYFHDPDPKNKNSLVGNFAHWIQEDGEGSLWISTWGDGISKYDPKLDKFTNYRHDKTNPQSLASNNVWSLFVDSNGFIWSATDEGVSILDPENKTFVNYQHDPQNPESLSNNMVSRIREDGQGIFWISTYGGGLNRFDPETSKFKTYKHIADNPKSISNNNLWGVYIDSRQRIWIASEGGLNRFQPETETFISYQNDKTVAESLSSNTVTVMYEDRYGKLWLGTFGGGLNRFDPDKETFNRFRHDSENPFSLSNDIIMGICEDKAGAIWVATYGGIDKYDPGEYQFEYYRGDHFSSKAATTTKVRSIFQDSNGFIWMGTGGDGLSQLTENRELHFNFQYDENDPASISDNDIWAITEDRNGNLWIATHGGGLNQLNSARQSFVRYEHDPENPNTPSCDPLYDLAMDQQRDVLWIAAYLTGLDKLDLTANTFTHYKYDPADPDGIVSNWVTAVFVDSKGFVWVGTEAGLSVFDPEREKFTNFKHNSKKSDSLSSNMIQTIYEDSEKNIWIGTGGGLNRYDETTQSFQRYSKLDGLPGNHIAGIAEDDKGCLWISTDNGISKFDPENQTFRNYNRHDGLQGNRFLMHSVHQNEQGELFFGGTNGFNVFQPDRLKDNQYIPPILFTGFKLLNQDVPAGKDSVLSHHINYTDQISLNYTQNVFSLEFIALNYRNSSKNRYAYMMEGFDKDFISTDSDSRLVTYTNLNPGSYTFHVKGSNNDGVWNEKGKSIKIEILPPWWGTLWFQIIMLISLFVLILGAIRFRMHSIQKEKDELETQVAKRTRELNAWLEHSPVCTKIVDLDLNLQYMSSAGVKGLNIDDIRPFYGNPYPFHFYPQAFKDTMTGNLNKAKKTGDVIAQEAPVVDIDGNELWFHSTIVPVKDRKGVVEYLIIVSMDTTDRNLTAERLNRQLQVQSIMTKLLYLSLEKNDETEILNDIVMVLSSIPLFELEPKWTYFLLGEKPDVLYKVAEQGFDNSGITPCEQAPWGSCICGEAALTGKIVCGDCIKNKESNVENGPHGRYSVPLISREEKVIGAFTLYTKDGFSPNEAIEKICRSLAKVISNIIEAKKEKEEKRKLEAKLLHSQKMEAIGNLAGGIAHEFNNILSIIMGNNELLAEDLPEWSLARENSEEIQIASIRARDVVKQLLTFSRQDHTVKKVMDIRSVVHGSMKLIRSSTPANIEIREILADDAYKVLGNETQINQMIINLCRNAVDAMPTIGGVLTIELLNKTLDKEQAKHHSNIMPGPYVRLEVRDNGIGMDRETLDRVFEPYYTTKEIGKGTGIGLAVVHGIVERHGGSIIADSHPGKGATFTIYLPAHEGFTEDESDAPSVLPAGDERVLYVDDEPSIAKMGKHHLESLGYTAESTTDPLQALEMVKTNPNKFDLVISDMAMPKMTGDQLITEILKIRPEMPTIICTGYSAKISEKEAAKIGVTSFLMKPFDKAEFAQTVRKVLDENKEKINNNY